jgi:hypothetical protein
MKKLNIDDTFLISKMLDKMGFEFPDQEEGQNKNLYGAKLISFLLKKLHLAKEEIKELISSVSGKDVNKMGIAEIGKTLKEIAEQEGFMNFFK